MLTAVAYGIAVATVLALSAVSRSQPLQKLALVLLIAWASTNVAYAEIGSRAFPLIYPSIEAPLAVLVAFVGLRAKSYAALSVFVLYGLTIVTHLVAIIGGFTDLYAYKAAINASFSGQLLVVGGPSAWLAAAHLLSAGGQRPRGVHVGR